MNCEKELLPQRPGGKRKKKKRGHSQLPVGEGELKSGCIRGKRKNDRFTSTDNLSSIATGEIKQPAGLKDRKKDF